MSRSVAKSSLARETWRLWFDVAAETCVQRDAILEDNELTPNDWRALQSLHEHEGRPMSELAAKWDCDASNASWIVDRLVKLGFVERRPHLTDRRVKLIVLAPAGSKMKTALTAEFSRPPPELGNLTASELAGLAEVLRKIRQVGSQ